MKEVYALTWWYSDNSSFGIARVYVSRSAAEADLALMDLHCTDKVWSIIVTDFIGGSGCDSAGFAGDRG